MKSSSCVNLINYKGISEDESVSSQTSSSSRRPRDDDDDEEVNALCDAMKKRVKAIPKILDGKYFREGDKVQAICQICGAVRWGSVKGTGNFTRHINEKHADQVDEMKIYIKQGSTVNVIDNKQPTLKAYTQWRIQT